MPPKRTRGGTAKPIPTIQRPSENESKTPQPEIEAEAMAVPEVNAEGTDPAGDTSAMEDLPTTATSATARGDHATTSSSNPTSNQRGRGGARGSAPAPRAKRPFAPRTTTRRSQAERDSLGATEAAKEAERERDIRAKQAEERRRAERQERLKQSWNNDRRGRGRGGYMGDRKTGASGPFSQGTTEGKVKHFVPHRKSGATGGESKAAAGTRVKSEDGAVGPSRSSRRVVQDDEDDDVTMQEVKKEDGGYVSSDDEGTGGQRRDVDTINLVSDEEDDDGGRRERASSMRPVRLKRVEHQERRVGVSTGQTTAEGDGDSDNDLFVSDEADRSRLNTASKSRTKARSKDVEVVGENRIWQGAWGGDEDTKPQIKDEPEDDLEMTTAPPLLRPQSPESTRKEAREKGKSTAKAFNGRKRPTFNTVEEEQEWERYQSDLQTLVDELGDVDVDTDGEANEDYVRAKSEAVYLFQFPPVLPTLQLASQLVKPDPETTTPAAPSSPKQTKRAATIAPKSDPENPIKVEDDPPGTAQDQGGPKLPYGAVGKLRVHKSGKITLDYGGTSLQLNKGLDASFLQDAVITKLPAPGSVHANGSAYALGPVRGKFVITPDWDAVVG